MWFYQSRTSQRPKDAGRMTNSEESDQTTHNEDPDLIAVWSGPSLFAQIYVCPKNFRSLHYEPRHEKTWFCHMQTTKAQITLHIHAVWSAPLLLAD